MTSRARRGGDRATERSCRRAANLRESLRKADPGVPTPSIASFPGGPGSDGPPQASGATTHGPRGPSEDPRISPETPSATANHPGNQLEAELPPPPTTTQPASLKHPAAGPPDHVPVRNCLDKGGGGQGSRARLVERPERLWRHGHRLLVCWIDRGPAVAPRGFFGQRPECVRHACHRRSVAGRLGSLGDLGSDLQRLLERGSEWSPGECGAAAERRTRGHQHHTLLAWRRHTQLTPALSVLRGSHLSLPLHRLSGVRPGRGRRPSWPKAKPTRSPSRTLSSRQKTSTSNRCPRTH